MEEIHLDYSLKTIEERRALVDKITKTAPSSTLTPKYLEILANYLLDISLTKEERKQKFITTSNRQVTIDKRETSYEELVSKFENGEDGVYNLINMDGKNMYLSPKLEITEEDIAEVPGLRELRENIEKIEALAKTATGKRKFLLKKQAIEMRQEQYILKGAWKPAHTTRNAGGTFSGIEISDEVHFDEDGEPTSNAIVTFFKPEHVSAILCNYEILKEGLKHKYHSDFHYLMRDFDKLMAEALEPYPAYKTLVEAKTEGMQNIDVQKLLIEKHDLHHTVEYISSLWRNKIPKIISEKAKEDYLIWHYTEVERGTWKRCSRCGEVKLAHNRFFSKNSSSKDGFYSICKCCRNSKNKEK